MVATHLPDRILPPGPRWIGVKGHFREPNASRTTDLYFFQRGYCGVQPVANDMVNACAMVRSDCATTLEESFRLHPKLAERAARWTPVTQPVSTAPLVYRDIQPVRGSLIYAGDAAAFIDPFVGDGISIALRSGRLAAQWVCRFLAGKISPAVNRSLTIRAPTWRISRRCSRRHRASDRYCRCRKRAGLRLFSCCVCPE